MDTAGQMERLKLEAAKYNGTNGTRPEDDGRVSRRKFSLKKKVTGRRGTSKSNSNEAYEYDLGENMNESKAHAAWKQENAPAQDFGRNQPYQYDLGGATEEYDLDDSERNQPGAKRSSRKGLFRSKGNTTDPHEKWKAKEIKKAAAADRKDRRKSRAREPKEQKSILRRNGLFGRKKNQESEQEVPVEYYVGRPSQQQEFYYRPSAK